MIPLDVGDIIADFAEALTITRASAGTVSTSGIYVAGTTSSVSIEASVQPVTGREVELLPDGFANSGSVKIYTQTALIPYVAEGPPADVLTWNGRAYDIHKAQDWDTTGTYFKYIGALNE